MPRLPPRKRDPLDDLLDQLPAALQLEFRQLSPMKKQFVLEYLVDLDAKHAAIRAGYSAKSAKTQGHMLVHEPILAAVIEAILRPKLLKVNLTIDAALQKLSHLLHASKRDTQDLDGSPLPIHLWPERALDAVTGYELAPAKKRGQPALPRKVKWEPKLQIIRTVLEYQGVLQGGGSASQNHQLDDLVIRRRDPNGDEVIDAPRPRPDRPDPDADPVAVPPASGAAEAVVRRPGEREDEHGG